MRFRLIHLGGSLLALAFVVPWSCSKSTEGDNMYQPMKNEFEIRSIRTVEPGVEIEIVCRSVLYIGGLYPVLRIGPLQFDESRAPDDGDRHAMIFPIGAGDFEAMEQGAEVVICWGPCGPDERPEEIPGMSGYGGTLDKTLLDR